MSIIQQPEGHSMFCNNDTPTSLAEMAKSDRSLLLYLESQAVEKGGLLEAVGVPNATGVTPQDIIDTFGDGTFGNRGPHLNNGRFTYTKITD